MDSTTMGTVLWISAAAVFVLYIMRRRGRKTKSFR